MYSKEKNLSILHKKLHCFYEERRNTKKMLRNSRNKLKKIRNYKLKQSIKICLQNDYINDCISIINYCIEKIKYLNKHIFSKHREYNILFHEKNEIINISKFDNNFYSNVYIEAILGKYDIEAA